MKKNAELLNALTNSETGDNLNYPLITHEGIKGTPFTLINQNEKWFMVIGDHRVTEPTETKEETLEKLETEKWLLTMHIAVIVQSKANDIREQNMQIKLAMLEAQKETEEILQQIP